MVNQTNRAASEAITHRNPPALNIRHLQVVNMDWPRQIVSWMANHHPANVLSTIADKIQIVKRADARAVRDKPDAFCISRTIDERGKICSRTRDGDAFASEKYRVADGATASGNLHRIPFVSGG